MPNEKFTVVAHFKEKDTAKEYRCGVYETERPIDAIVLAKKVDGEEAAKKLGCELWQLSWSAEQDFLG